MSDSKKMVLEKYSSSWLLYFQKIKREIEIASNSLAYTFEHVGSTSVPHLDSKPIIDIDITYSNLPDFEKIKLGLEKIGYYHTGNQGIEDREAFKRNGNLQMKY